MLAICCLGCPGLRSIFPIRVIQRRLGRANLPWGRGNGVLLSWWPFDELHIRPLDKDKAWVDFPQGQGKEGSTLFPKEEARQVTFHEWQAFISSMFLQNTSHIECSKRTQLTNMSDKAR